MNGTVRAVIVAANGTIESTEIEDTLATLKGIVGGWIEAVYLPRCKAHAYCNEEGKIEGLPVNEVATKIAHAWGWPVGDVLCGDVVFLGDGPDGTEADVPAVLRVTASALRR